MLKLILWAVSASCAPSRVETLIAQVARVREIPGTPTCPKCTIVFQPVKRLGDTVGAAMIGVMPSIVVDHRGQIYLYQEDIRPGTVVVIGPSGIVREIGREGAGPGEFRAIKMAVVGDTLHLFDFLNVRHTVVGPKGDIIRAVPWGRFGRAQFIADDRWVVFGDLPTPERVGLPLHLVNDSGRVLRSFGADPPAYPFPDGGATAVVDARRNIWVHNQLRYELSVWDSSGVRRQTYRRKVSWFPPDPSVAQARNDILRDVVVDDNGLLWVVFLLSRKPHVQPRSVDPHDFDTVVEVIDPRAGRLVTSVRLSKTAIWAIGDNVVVFPGEDEQTGQPFLQIARFVLKRP